MGEILAMTSFSSSLKCRKNSLWESFCFAIRRTCFSACGRDLKPTGNRTLDFIFSMASTARDLRADRILLLDVSELVNWTSYFCIATVRNIPQVAAISFNIEKKGLAEFSQPVTYKPSRSEWELQDFGDVIIHLLTQQQRDFYDLEGCYSAADLISFEDYAREL